MVTCYVKRQTVSKHSTATNFASQGCSAAGSIESNTSAKHVAVFPVLGLQANLLRE